MTNIDWEIHEIKHKVTHYKCFLVFSWHRRANILFLRHFKGFTLNVFIKKLCILSTLICVFPTSKLISINMDKILWRINFMSEFYRKIWDNEVGQKSIWLCEIYWHKVCLLSAGPALNKLEPWAVFQMVMRKMALWKIMILRSCLFHRDVLFWTSSIIP